MKVDYHKKIKIDRPKVEVNTKYPDFDWSKVRMYYLKYLQILDWRKDFKPIMKWLEEKDENGNQRIWKYLKGVKKE